MEPCGIIISSCTIGHSFPVVHPSAYARHTCTCKYVPCVHARKILTNECTNTQRFTQLIYAKTHCQQTLSENLAVNMQLLYDFIMEKVLTGILLYCSVILKITIVKVINAPMCALLMQPNLLPYI